MAMRKRRRILDLRYSEAAAHPPERVRPASARKKKLPAITTSSPGFTPLSTSSDSPSAAPSFTVRSAKRRLPPSSRRHPFGLAGR